MTPSRTEHVVLWSPWPPWVPLPHEAWTQAHPPRWIPAGPPLGDPAPRRDRRPTHVGAIVEGILRMVVIRRQRDETATARP